MRPLRLHVRAQRTAELDCQKSTAESHLGASSLLTSYSVRGGRVCELNRVGPSKVTSEKSGLGGLGLSPRPPSSIGRMASAAVLWGARGKQKVARSRATQALLHRE